jgi:general secretion pathway protein G/type IV pilus assembly protein PilA
MINNLSKNKKRGFTLLELLIVIAILALLTSIIVITLNPAELLRKSRDTQRIADIASIRTALNIYIVDNTSPDLDGASSCTSNRFYSLNGTTYSIGSAAGKTAVLVAGTTFRDVDGTGWIPVNLTTISSGAPLSVLPVDPTNSPSTSPVLYYTYECDGTALTFELNAQMESSYFANTGTGDVESTDGGNAENLYEVGSDPGLDLSPTPATGFFL